MRKILLTLFLSIGFIVQLTAQCSWTNQFFGTGTAPAPGNSVTITTCAFTEEISTINAMQIGQTYTFAYTGGSGNFVTIYDNAQNIVASGASPVTYVATYTGTYYSATFVDAACNTDFSCHTLVVTNVPPPPPTPPTPTQDPTPPTCPSGTNLDLAGPPPTNVQWYWQTSATGTSTANPYTGPYTVFLNGTYYARAYNSSTMLWSTNSSSITVSNIPVAPMPPTPVAAQNPACSSTTISVSPGAPMGLNYYWQGTMSTGTSQSQDASIPYTVTSTGTYYVNSYDNSTQCWSNPSSIFVTVDTYIPVAPIISDTLVNACVGSTSIPLSATPGAASGSAVVTFAAPYTLMPGGPYNLVGNLSIPAGATITSSVINFNNFTTTGGTWASECNFALSGAATHPTTFFPGFGVTNANFSYNPTVNPMGGPVTLTMNNTFVGDVLIGSISLTVNYTLPVPTINWYATSTGGTSMGSGSPFEAVGSSVLPNTATAGNYIFYAGASSGACMGSRDSVKVSLSSVLAELVPVDASCNGNNNGSFTLGTVQCGTAPFTYSIDGGTFGAIPTNLTAGTYSVVIMDATSQMSSAIPLLISEPGAPMNLTTTDINYYSAVLSWDPQGNETSWIVEYGPTGFTPGTGMTVTANFDTLAISGLTENTSYDFYVTAVCGVGSETAGPATFTTNQGFYTFDNACGPGFTDISSVVGVTGTALADDASIPVTMPFSFDFQGLNTNAITISNNGFILVGPFGDGLYPFNDDLDSEEGDVYYATLGTAPNRQFIVQWDNRPHFSGVIGQNVTFQVIIEEATSEVYFIYDDVVFGGTHSYADYGANAFIQADGPLASITVSAYSSAYLQNNSCAHFYYDLCPNPINLTFVTEPDAVTVNWNAGLYGETMWTIIYGPAGFDPATSGTTITSGTNSAYITGLSQLTDYDLYIYSECSADNLTSGGLLGSFTTLPFCADPISVNATSAVDSIFAAWNWSSSDPSYPLQNFNIQYGMNNFAIGGGTVFTSNQMDFADTITDASLLAGGVYQIYVQAVCTTGDTSNFVGPVSVVMPLTNDSTCLAETLPVDGTVNYFNNSGATVQTNEQNIAPTVTGAQTTTGWANAALNFTTWFKFNAPASGNMRISGIDQGFDGQIAVYDVTSCSTLSTGSYMLVAANDDEIGGSSLAPNFTICGLTPGAEYYLLHDSRSTFSTGMYSIALSEIDLEAGAANSLTRVCRGDTVNLFNTINGNDAGGMFVDLFNTQQIVNDSNFVTTTLADIVYDFQYMVVDGCASDSITSQVEIVRASDAGDDGAASVCRNEDVDLLGVLNGSIDLGGTWYNPNNSALPNGSITASNIPGNFNYTYITGNGVCPDDTSLVTITVLSTCNELSLDELAFVGVSVYPNPTNTVINIAAGDLEGAFNIVVRDMNGRDVITSDEVLSSNTKVTLGVTKLEPGMYFVNLFNENNTTVFKVVVE